MQSDCPSIADLMLLMTSRLEETTRAMDLESAGQFLDEILSAKRIYLAGAGRSGLVARAFAQRLMHLGFESYVIGETITPAFGPEDVLVAFSGSGETRSVVDTCETAREIGGGDLPRYIDARLAYRAHGRLHRRDREQPAQGCGYPARLRDPPAHRTVPVDLRFVRPTRDPF